MWGHQPRQRCPIFLALRTGQVVGEGMVPCKWRTWVGSFICVSRGHVRPLLAQMYLHLCTHLPLLWPAELWNSFCALCIHFPLREAGENTLEISGTLENVIDVITWERIGTRIGAVLMLMIASQAGLKARWGEMGFMHMIYPNLHPLLPWPALGTPELWDSFHALCIHLSLRESGENSETFWDLLRIWKHLKGSPNETFHCLCQHVFLLAFSFPWFLIMSHDLLQCSIFSMVCWPMDIKATTTTTNTMPTHTSSPFLHLCKLRIVFCLLYAFLFIV